MNTNKTPIDAVIAWVDGSDPKLVEKRKLFQNSELKQQVPGAESTRFSSLNEVSYCILSILKFAPFIRNIFIVTDNQDPKLNKVVHKYFPKRVSDLRIVDHKEIFHGYENYLPTFNSICISNMLWRIKGLSEKFVYFNDDIFLIRPVNPSIWFRNRRPVLRGAWAFPPFERLLWDNIKLFFQKVFLNKEKEKTPSFQINQWNAAHMQGFRFCYFRSGHTPLALNKKRIGDFFNNNPKILEENIKHRFRKYSQFNTVALANHLEYNFGNKNFAPSKAVYMQPKNSNKSYVDRKFKQCKSDKGILFLCVQSLDLASKPNQVRVTEGLNRILGIQLNLL